jgi:hypothetical protein
LFKGLGRPPVYLGIRKFLACIVDEEASSNVPGVALATCESVFAPLFCAAFTAVASGDNAGIVGGGGGYPISNPLQWVDH